LSPNWKNYQGKILRRCDLCGKFNASYRVEDQQLGSLILCQKCWSRRAAAKIQPTDAPSIAAPAPSEENHDEHPNRP
jgi:hypothetical protein